MRPRQGDGPTGCSVTEHHATVVPTPTGPFVACSCGWEDADLDTWPEADASRRAHLAAPAVPALRVVTLTTDQAQRLAQELLEPRGSRIRIGIDTDGVKTDVGWGWSRGRGELA